MIFLKPKLIKFPLLQSTGTSASLRRSIKSKRTMKANSQPILRCQMPMINKQSLDIIFITQFFLHLVSDMIGKCFPRIAQSFVPTSTPLSIHPKPSFSFNYFPCSSLDHTRVLSSFAQLDLHLTKFNSHSFVTNANREIKEKYFSNLKFKPRRKKKSREIFLTSFLERIFYVCVGVKKITSALWVS